MRGKNICGVLCQIQVEGRSRFGTKCSVVRQRARRDQQRVGAGVGDAGIGVNGTAWSDIQVVQRTSRVARLANGTCPHDRRAAAQEKFGLRGSGVIIGRPGHRRTA